MVLYIGTGGWDNIGSISVYSVISIYKRRNHPKYALSKQELWDLVDKARPINNRILNEKE